MFKNTLKYKHHNTQYMSDTLDFGNTSYVCWLKGIPEKDVCDCLSLHFLPGQTQACHPEYSTDYVYFRTKHVNSLPKDHEGVIYRADICCVYFPQLHLEKEVTDRESIQYHLLLSSAPSLPKFQRLKRQFKDKKKKTLLACLTRKIGRPWVLAGSQLSLLVEFYACEIVYQFLS